MAKIIEELVLVRLSKITRNDDTPDFTLPDDLLANVEAFVAEMVGDPSVVVEVTVDADA